MPNITIRNLTVHPVQLTKVQRFGGEKINSGSLLSNVTTKMSNLLNATDAQSHEVHASGDATLSSDVDVSVEPFCAALTEVPAPEAAASEVVRLTFKTEDHSYETDVPSPTSRSAVMKKLDDGPHDLTAVYVPGGPAPVVAVFASARLDAWMQELNDGWLLSALSMPGTHNSPTCHKALPSVRCQAVGVPEQLDHGVRFLDIRVSANPDDDVLTLVHSAFPISLTGSKPFGDMVEDVYRFLDAHPSETVVMSVKREGTGKGTDGQMAGYLRSAHVDKRSDKWWTAPKVPTLGEARGKIVLIRRFGLDDGDMKDNGYGIDAQQWPDNCEDGVGGGGGFRIQDFYEVTESQNIDKKIDYSRGQLERAAEQTCAISGGGEPPAPFFINFLSASNFFNATCWPERIAAKVNPAVMEYLCGCHGVDGKGPKQLKVGSAGTGVVITDWVGANDNWDLIRCIVGMNARLQHNQ